MDDSELNRIADAISLRLADALDAFWNAAIGHVRADMYAEPGVSGVISAMATGLAAVSQQLRDDVKEKV